ncbi:phage tail protein [Chitinophagaceae bacterium MMS25-I14]
MEGTMANITLFAADFAPKNWAYCNGATLAISTNQALFALLGTTYGGNGVQTFQLPNLQSRIPVGTGQGGGLSSYELGEVGGTENNTMTLQNLPMHNHASVVTAQLPVNGTSAITDGPEGNFYGPSTSNMYNSTAGAGQFFGTMNVTANLSPNGSSAPIPNIMPYLALNYVICMYGIFPSRN